MQRRTVSSAEDGTVGGKGMDLKDLSALELSTAIKKGEAGVEEAVKVSLEQIKKSEDTVHAFLETDEEKVYQRVKEVEAGIASGKYSGPLAGVPIAVKDNICTKGRKTTCASKILGNFVPPYDAEAVKKLEEAGMIILGKTNMDEFAMGSTSETSAFGITTNPWDQTKVPWIFRWFMCRSGRRRGFPGTWFGYRWFDSSAIFLLWRGRDEADLWNGFSLWIDCVCLFT